MKTFVKVASSLALVATFSVHAAETGAGCGLGAEVLDGKNSRGANIAAAILNNLVIPNTFFMTTGDGLMGCDPTQTVKREEAKKIFVASNLDQISSDAARGAGDHLEALAYLMGIQESDKAAFVHLTQAEFDSVFASSRPEHVLAALDQAMARDASLSKYAAR